MANLSTKRLLDAGTGKAGLNVRMTQEFAIYWERETGLSWEIAADDCQRALNFVLRAGGPPVRNTVVEVRLRMTLRPVNAFSSWQKGKTICATFPYKDSGYGVPCLYKNCPTAPVYTCYNIREALLAAVVHEGVHWVGIGNRGYWRNSRVRMQTEFVCELLAAVALEKFFPLAAPRLAEM